MAGWPFRSLPPLGHLATARPFSQWPVIAATGLAVASLYPVRNGRSAELWEIGDIVALVETADARLNKMAKRNERYFDVIVESYEPHSTAGLHGPVHIRPIEGQPFPTHLRVECSKDLVDTAKYPVGTRFKIRAKLTDRLGSGEFLYSYFGWPREVLGKPQKSK
jgi:hypothetical protein